MIDFRFFVYLCAFVISLLSTMVRADAAVDQKQAHAMEVGLFLGGSATQYDECAKRGLAPTRKPSAEDEANSFFKEAAKRADDKDKNGVTYALKGWDLAKQKIQQLDPEHWNSHCEEIIRQWEKYSAMIKKG